MTRRGFQRQRAGDDDALALPAGKGVRVALPGIRGMPDQGHQRTDPLGQRLARQHPVHQQRLGDHVATVIRGLSEANGSWKIIRTSRWNILQRRAVERDHIDFRPSRRDR